VSDDIIPVSRSLFLCDFHVGYQDGRVDLYGLFNAIRPAIYPHTRRHLVVFAQLVNGLGDVPFFFEIRRERDDELVRATAEHTIHFADRRATIQAVMTIEDVLFAEPGMYVVSLFCHNTWVCDTLLSLE
jgi:hypothetical protein